MDKLKMSTPDLTKENIKQVSEFLKSVFPDCVKEAEDEEGNLVEKIDFDLLKTELGNETVEGLEERYRLDWPGKKRSILKANTPITKTLRPIKEDSVDWDNTQNLYIEGDNFDTLKILQESYLGKIKMIYIDPPYNTGNNLIYKNDFSHNEEEEDIKSGAISDDGYKMVTNTKTNGRFHSDWLSMMYERLKVARDLLTTDGCIVLAIDDSELVNLTKICDDIFGEDNRIGIVTVVHKPEGRNQAKYFATSNEYALFYCKDLSEFEFENVILNTESLKEYDQSDEKGSYKLISAIAKNHGREGFDKNLRINNPKNFYPIYVSKDLNEISLDKEYPNGYIAYPITATQERTWRYIKESMQEKIKAGEFVAQLEKGQIKIYEKYRVDKGELIKTHRIDKKYNANTSGTKILDELMKVKTFDFPKSLYLLIDILKICTKKDDMILDFFSGSGTTAHACMQLNTEDGGNRKFIMAQLPEKIDESSEAYKAGYKTICDIGKERIRRAAKKIKEETNAGIDYGFRVYRVDESCMKDVYYHPSKATQDDLGLFVSNIKDDRTPEDLLTQVILSLGLTLDLPIEEKNIKGNKVFYVAGNSLVACFDDNIDFNIIEEISKDQPLKLVFRDSCFKNDADRINIETKMKKLSPDTSIKVI